MTPRQAAQLVAALKAAFPNTPIQPGTTRVYATMLADLDFGVAQRAVEQAISESEFFPTIAAIRSRYAERVTGLPSAEQAWLEVSRAALRYDQNDSGTWWPEWSTPLIADALVGVGGLGCVANAASPGTDRAHFIRIYDHLRQRDIRAIQVGNVALAGGPDAKALPAGRHEETA